jgi:hypothetical protein
VRHAVDQEAARPADTLPAVVLEGNGRQFQLEEILIERVEHLQEGHVRGDVPDLIVDEVAPCICVLLPPDSERQIHGYL